MTSKTVVVDASLAIKWVLEEPGSGDAYELLEEWKDREVGMLAPEVFALDAAEALYRRHNEGQLTVREAKEALEALLDSGPALVSDIGSYTRTIEYASNFALLDVREAHYIVLAQRENCQCWTADERLWRAAGGALPWLRWLGEGGGDQV